MHFIVFTAYGKLPKHNNGFLGSKCGRSCENDSSFVRTQPRGCVVLLSPTKNGTAARVQAADILARDNDRRLKYAPRQFTDRNYY